MQKTSVIVSILVFVGILGWFLLHGPRTAGPGAPPAEAGAATGASNGADSSAASADRGPARPARPARPVSPFPKNVAESGAAGGEIEKIISDPRLDHSAAATRLLAIVRDEGHPENVRKAALTHALNLLPAENYSQTLAGLLEANLSAEVFEPAWLDVFERPPADQLDAAWQIALKTGHPCQEQSVELVEKLIGPQQDRNPAQWKAAVDDFRQQIPKSTADGVGPIN